VRFSLDSDGERWHADVLAISTESRDAGAEVFNRALAEHVARVPELHPHHVFKKIDSTLRGSVGLEVAVVLGAFGCDVALVTPAFPAMGRRVEGGYLRIAGNASFAPVEAAACFRNHGVGPHRYARPGAIAQAVAAGARFVLLDAACDADLDTIVSQGLALPQRVLWAGSAGLASALARAGTAGGQAPVCQAPAAAPAIFCLGSDHAVTVEQQERLIHHRGAALFPPDAATPAAILAALQRGQPVVLRIRVGESTAGRIGECLANATGPLVLSGGATAALVCRALDIHAIDLRLEIAPGIPCGVIRGGPFHQAPVVTKSGGFGGPDALIQVADFFA
jgi:uncharacterized protein YgbK (DUF1537 family)